MYAIGGELNSLSTGGRAENEFSISFASNALALGSLIVVVVAAGGRLEKQLSFL